MDREYHTNDILALRVKPGYHLLLIAGHQCSLLETQLVTKVGSLSW